MDKLPTELQHEVFKYLDTKDKFTCSLVSKNWNYYVKKHVYCHLDFIKDTAKLEQAILYFQKYQDIARHVIYIKIEKCNNLEMFIPQLIDIFPNVKKASFGEDYNKILQSYNFCPTDRVEDYLKVPELSSMRNTATVPTNIWKNINEMELLMKLNMEPLMTNLVLSSVCQNLTTLFIGTHKRTKRRQISIYDRQIIDSLKNAPQLATLFLNSLCLTIQDLEKLHEYTPRLMSLTIISTKFFMTDGSQNSDLLNQTLLLIDHPKSTRLSYLCINFSDEDVGLEDGLDTIINRGDSMSEETFLALFSYIANKYSNLEALIITCDGMLTLDSIFNTSRIQMIMLPLLSRCPKLQSYDMMFCPITTIIFNKMGECNINLQSLTLHVDLQNVDQQCSALLKSKQNLKEISIILRDSMNDHDDTQLYDDSDFDDDDDNDPVSSFFPTLPVINVYSRLHNTNITLVHLLQPLKQLEHLTHLTIFAYMNGNNLLMLSRFLKELVSLESISFGHTIIQNEVLDQPIPVTFDTCNIKHIELVTMELYTTKQLRGVNKYFHVLLPCCPKLEVFHLDTDIANLYYCKGSIPFTLILNFTTQKNLRLVKIKYNSYSYVQHYYIVHKNQPEKTGYYHYDTTQKALIKKDNIIPETYHVTVVLDKPVLLNSARI